MNETEAPNEEIPDDTESESFPAFQGSFVLQSTDGIRFHTHQYLLKHVSGFFHDLFAFPTSKSGISSTNELSLNLNSAILHDLLTLIDPNKRNPVMEPTTLADLIEAAKFYRIPCIIAWFEDTVLLQGTINFFGEPEEDSFLKRYPLMTLHLSHSLGLRHCVYMAMQELCICQSRKLTERYGSNVNIDIRVHFHTLSLRQRRVQFYHGFVNLLTEPNSREPAYNASPTCTFCMRLQTRWFARLMSTAFDQPDWTVFEQILRDLPICPNRHQTTERWVERMKDIIEKRAEKLNKADENLVPAWLEAELKVNAQIHADLNA